MLYQRAGKLSSLAKKSSCRSTIRTYWPRCILSQRCRTAFQEQHLMATCRDGESEENVDALTTLWRRLRAEAERAAASPVERLLDDVLLLQNAPMSSEERKRQVRGL